MAQSHAFCRCGEASCNGEYSRFIAVAQSLKVLADGERTVIGILQTDISQGTTGDNVFPTKVGADFVNAKNVRDNAIFSSPVAGDSFSKFNAGRATTKDNVALTIASVSFDDGRHSKAESVNNQIFFNPSNSAAGNTTIIRCQISDGRSSTSAATALVDVAAKQTPNT